MIAGFAPNWLYGQQNAGLGIYIAPGDVNGIHFNGGIFSVPNNAVTVFYVTAQGLIQSGQSVPDGAFAIAQVTSGPVITSTIAQFSQLTYPKFFNTNPGILNITDLRNW